MQTEDLIVDQCGEWEVVKEICEIFPHVRVPVLSQAFVIEAIHLGNLSRLMIAAQDCDALRVSDFEGNEEGDCLDGEVAAVNIVTCGQSAC